MSERYSDRYNTWLNTAGHPQIVSDVLVVDGDNGQLRLRRWNPDLDALDATEWAAAAREVALPDRARVRGLNAGRDSIAGRSFAVKTRSSWCRCGTSWFLARPTPGPQTVTPVFGFTIIVLNMPYIREQMLPELRGATLHARGRRRLSCGRHRD